MAISTSSKQEKIKVINYFPTKNYGREGDIVVANIRNKGLFFCIKANGQWYAQTKMQPLNKINDIFIKHLKSEKITLKNIKNSEISADKFLVSSNGNIRYRTGNQTIEDLGINSFDIDYKTAYCSLGQYSNKETCEANGGVWYLSENDSHDSISSTAENQLLTVSQSVGNVDAEPTLLYDGSTLEIKYNSDYDDNWQTSAQTDLLKLSYSTRSATMNFDSAGKLTLDCGGDIELNADGGDVKFKATSADLATINGTGLKIDNISGSSSSTSFLTENSGVVEKRTIPGLGVITALNNATVNELVTVGATTTELDSESGLTFDGNTLTITSDDALTSQLVITHAGTDFFAIDAMTNGATKIKTYDAVGTSGNLEIESDGDMLFDCGTTTSHDMTLDAAGHIILKATNNQIIFNDGSDDFGAINVGTPNIINLKSSTNYNIKLESQGTGDIDLDSGGDIILDSNDGNFIAKKAGTEFSVANSAYAGMILGCRVLGHDAGRAQYILTNAFVTLHADATVRFIAPPSGVVEVFVQAGYLDSLSGRYVYFGLSDNATYNTIGLEHEELVNMTDETDQRIIQNIWVVSGLTAGDTYNYWFGLKANLAGSGSLNYGGIGSGHYSPFIMKVTALPTAVADFAEYD
jgi:ribonuclease BN (tRNA processing enzyme)